MNPELREMLGKAAFNAVAFGRDDEYNWETASEEVRENFRTEAQAVALALAEVTLPALQSLVFAFTGKQIELHFEEKP
jgi:hypothetical protein